MIRIRKIYVAAAALLAGLAVLGGVDFGWNESRALYALAGRDRLVEACLPELQRGLVSRGFSPSDVEFEPRPHISLGVGRPRSLGAAFTFADGAAETRVEGLMACVVGPSEVRVDFRTSARPVRVG